MLLLPKLWQSKAKVNRAKVKRRTTLILLFMATILPSSWCLPTVCFFRKLAIFDIVISIFGFSGEIYGFSFHFLAFCFRLWLIIRFSVKGRIVTYCNNSEYAFLFYGYSFTRNPHFQSFLSLFFHFLIHFSFVFGLSTSFHGFSGCVYG